MIKEVYCSFEIAKLLKEKGFDGRLHYWYNNDGDIIFSAFRENNSSKLNTICPTHQMAMAWLREKGIYINIFIDDDSEDPWTYNIFVRKDGKMTCAYHHHGRYFPLDGGYNIALEEALKYCLENLI